MKPLNLSLYEIQGKFEFELYLNLILFRNKQKFKFIRFDWPNPHL